MMILILRGITTKIIINTDNLTWWTTKITIIHSNINFDKNDYNNNNHEKNNKNNDE